MYPNEVDIKPGSYRLSLSLLATLLAGVPVFCVQVLPVGGAVRPATVDAAAEGLQLQGHCQAGSRDDWGGDVSKIYMYSYLKLH